MADGTSGGPGAGTRAAKPGRKPSRNRFTGRAGLLALALCAVMVTVAYPLRQYLAQRSQISNLQRQNDDTAKQVASLQTELARWNDPAYVGIQAREQLHYVRPGETGFIVPNPSASPEPLGIPTPGERAWYDKLWGTVKSPQASTPPSASPQSTPSSKASPSPTK
ncbi:MAG: FtsB family cell division protein [Actinocrinis sp.]